ncbi:MAG: MoaD/ThiS family protein [Flavobacteriales bacterium]
MKVKVKYLGLIADHTRVEEETFELEKATFEDLENRLVSKYAFLYEISYKITVNHAFGEKGMILNEKDEIAVLPPFAGG